MVVVIIGLIAPVAVALVAGTKQQPDLRGDCRFGSVHSLDENLLITPHILLNEYGLLITPSIPLEDEFPGVAPAILLVDDPDASVPAALLLNGYGTGVSQRGAGN